MSNLAAINTYQAVLSALGAEFEPCGSIAKRAVTAINALGPFEIGSFEVCDVIQMLGHLFAADLIDRDIQMTPIHGGMSLHSFMYRMRTAAEVQHEFQF